MTQHPWAVNQLKLNRAIGWQITAEDKSEEALKAKYLEMGGLLNKEYAEPIIETPINLPEEIIENELTPELVTEPIIETPPIKETKPKSKAKSSK